MNQKDYLKAFTNECNEMKALTSKKNADYATDSDAFLNFRLIESLTNGDITAEEGIVVRMSDKLQRISNLMTRKAKVTDEQITDTCRDLANYAIILRLLLKHNEKKTK